MTTTPAVIVPDDVRKLAEERVKQRARRMVRAAIATGKLKRPTECTRCGKGGTRSDGVTLIQGHHRDYTKPLDVEWICQSCHRQETPHPTRENSSGFKHPHPGSRNGNARLTESQAAEIKKRFADGERIVDLIGQYPVSATQLKDIKKGRYWTHVGEQA